jgi:hypothetical protein
MVEAKEQEDTTLNKGIHNRAMTMDIRVMTKGTRVMIKGITSSSNNTPLMTKVLTRINNTMTRVEPL